MRIGIRVAQNQVAGVYVRADGSHGTQRIRVGDAGPVAAFDTLLGRLLREGAPPRGADTEHTNSINFDVSALLRPQAKRIVTVIRVAPRPPADLAHEISGGVTALSTSRVMHVRGGHTKFGEELVPLDTEALHAIAREAQPGERYVVTAVGSLLNQDHELEAGRILLEHARPASLGYSHSFHSSSFVIRERTAVVNSSLIPDAESLGTSLALVAGRRVPHARLFVTTNDGGCVPLARLSVSPVHSMMSARPSELIGAAALSDLSDGRLVVSGESGTFFGEIIDGVPTVLSQSRPQGGEPFATKSANLIPVTESLLSGQLVVPTLVLTREDAEVPDWDPTKVIRADADLCALGAACAPLTDWVNRIVRISTAAEVEQALSAARAQVGARLVSFGAPPSQVRILESRVVATPYENASVVSVRVHGVAGEIVASMVDEGAGHEAE